jgi:hypothetical protein
LDPFSSPIAGDQRPENPEWFERFVATYSKPPSEAAERSAPEVTPSSSWQDVERSLAKAVPATGIRGYWEALAENATTWAHEVSGHPFWLAAQTASQAWTAQYHAAKRDSLLPKIGLPNFTGKGMPRLKEKTLSVIRRDGIGKLFSEASPVPHLNDLERRT